MTRAQQFENGKNGSVIAGCRDVLDVLCPMHAMLSASGHVHHVGPTLRRLRTDETVVGKRFLEVFRLLRPRSVSTVSGLLAQAGTKLHLEFRSQPRTGLKGVLVPLPDGGAIVNLSFGISILEAVQDYALTNADFSATDLTTELLYLVEAKSAAMDASRALNLRLQGAMIAAEEQAFTDTLTGLKNRRALDHVLERYVETGRSFSMMHLDLDYFKAVNDTHGHAAGDHVLQVAARAMVDETRDDDTVARFGGDEFVLIFDGLLDHLRLGAIAERLIARLEVPTKFGELSCQISGSIGIVRAPGAAGRNAQALLQAADEALYAAKHAGRGRFRFADAPVAAQKCEAIGSNCTDADSNPHPQKKGTAAR